MQKTRRLMDESIVSFQLFLVLFYYTWFRKPNFCVQAMSKQYLDVCFFLGGEHVQKLKFLASFISSYFEIHVVKG